MTERDWRRLLETINRGNCVLVMGPEVVFDPEDAERTPLNILLARQLAASLSSDTPEIIRDDLTHVAQLRYNQDGDRIDMELAVKDFYAPFAERSSDFHRNLALLPFTLCLTTTPARFMLNAFKVVPGKSPVPEFYHYRKHRSSNLSDPSLARPVVYHLYGDIEQLESLVLTETDLLECLVNVLRDAPPLAPSVAAQLKDKRTSFLFLGFGFQRWYARVLLHVLQNYDRLNRSLAVEGPGFFGHQDCAHATLFFEREHKIEFRHHSWSEFAGELRRRYEAQGRRVVPSPLPDDAPKVFLCHDSRDRDRVKTLEERLHERGIDTWRDKQDLRGGDNWDRRIEQVLRKQVDYVLVLETPHMLEPAESYVHKEIAEALERQKHFDEGQRFLIPTTLEPCAGLERLDHLNRVDLAEADGLDRLARSIQTDWSERRDRGGGNVG